jgi:hypothetical protein
MEMSRISLDVSSGQRAIDFSNGTEIDSIAGAGTINLGLYEMVSRRCRFIVVVDAGCDPDFAFEDLGNAVRKIYIDLGIRIHFDQLQSIKKRPKGEHTEQQRLEIPYCTTGVIDYETADGAEDNSENGYILYIKPAYHGTEGAGIVSYATAHPTFPHETTTDQ